MIKGFYLTLMMGPAVAVPVPQSVLDALVSVRVTSASGNKRSAFELTFNISNQSPLPTMFLVAGDTLLNIMRVIIVVTVNGTPDVLMDGVITKHQVGPSSEPGHSTVTLTGEDLSVVMDWIDFTGIPYPCMPPEARVGVALLKYMLLGVMPLVIPSVLVDVPIPIDRIPTQRRSEERRVGKECRSRWS